MHMHMYMHMHMHVRTYALTYGTCVQGYLGFAKMHLELVELLLELPQQLQQHLQQQLHQLQVHFGKAQLP